MGLVDLNRQLLSYIDCSFDSALAKRDFNFLLYNKDRVKVSLI